MGQTQKQTHKGKLLLFRRLQNKHYMLPYKPHFYEQRQVAEI